MDQNREIKQTWNNSKRWKQHIDKINKKYNINISEIETKKMSKKWKQGGVQGGSWITNHEERKLTFTVSR